MPRTSSASCNWPVPRSCSGIYEMGSRGVPCGEPKRHCCWHSCGHWSAQGPSRMRSLPNVQWRHGCVTVGTRAFRAVLHGASTLSGPVPTLWPCLPQWAVTNEAGPPRQVAPSRVARLDTTGMALTARFEHVPNGVAGAGTGTVARLRAVPESCTGLSSRVTNAGPAGSSVDAPTR